MYNQIKVTISPNAPYHSMYFGARAADAFSMKSKSRIRFNAATATTIRLKIMPKVPLLCINPMLIPKNPRINDTKYISAIAPVADITPVRKRAVALIAPVLNAKSIKKKVAKVNPTA